MTQINIIYLLVLVCTGLAGYLIGTSLSLCRERKGRKEWETKKSPEAYDVAPTEIPENDKDWHIRTDDVERIRAGIVECLRTYPACIVTLDKHNKDSSLNHGEAHALLLPFLKKGYFAYRDISGYNGSEVKRFRLAKHRDAEPNALEITEELLAKNEQL